MLLNRLYQVLLFLLLMRFGHPPRRLVLLSIIDIPLVVITVRSKFKELPQLLSPLDLCLEQLSLLDA